MPSASPTRHRWRQLARCRAYPAPDDFHPDPPQPPRPSALACCVACPVVAECLDAGRGSSGIWGGFNEAARAIIYATGWQLGRPIPTIRFTRQWVTLAEAAAVLGVERRRVRGWAERGHVDSMYAPLHFGQTTRLVDLDQCRAYLRGAN